MKSRLQYISQGESALEQEVNIRKALDHGADWIQLRWKNVPEEAFLQLSWKVKALCANYGATFIINDLVSIVRAVDADGIHLGLEDEEVARARAFLGPHKIIGGTANTVHHVLQRIAEGCDYIGLGPFRYTPTKAKLSPILGLSGYQEIIGALRVKKIRQPPVFAIGGITVDDLEAIKSTGVYGVALSNVITQSPTLIPSIQNALQ